jgi:hypothetical protein
MIRFESDNSGKWWEFLMSWKWPHQGFTVGYDFVQPTEQNEENSMTFFTVLIYLGPISLIYNWGNHDWDE